MGLFYIGTAVLVVLQFTLPKRLAFLPLLIAACHLPNLMFLNLGVGKFSPTRLVILAGLIRAISSGQIRWSRENKMDITIVVWAILLVLSSFFHHPRDHNPFTVRSALAFELLGGYLYARAYIRAGSDLLRLSRWLAIVLVPLAALMLLEKTTQRAPYGLIGGAGAPEVRQGRARAAGPFGHAILAGTVAGSCLPFMVMLRRRSPQMFKVGVAASFLIVAACASSGPIVTFAAAATGLVFWRWRTHIGRVWKGALVMLLLLQLVMKAPIWYLMAKVDFVGGSTGWHRAELITQALNHIDEWWLFGTDYTRNWFAYGIRWSEDATDITNWFLQMGVMGGMPVLLAFVALILISFAWIGREVRVLRRLHDPNEFRLWCLGSSLLSHVWSFLGISYFDQSYVFVAIVLGSVAGLAFPRPWRSAALRPPTVRQRALETGEEFPGGKDADPDDQPRPEQAPGALHSNGAVTAERTPEV